eukprot:Colp12_sorted_trinity150504_noHs@30006
MSNFPLDTKQFVKTINGVDTEFVLNAFQDRIFILVTQCNKMGTLLSAAKDMNMEVGSEPTYTIRVLLGKRDDSFIEVFARQIVEAMTKAECNKPLLLSAGFTSISIESLREMYAHILENKVW